jgi:hypothetical protein
MILPVVLYGCETWSLTLKEEHRLRVSENRVLRRTYGPEREEVTGQCRKLHNEELHNLNYSPNIIRVTRSRRMGWARHVARMRGMTERVADNSSSSCAEVNNEWRRTSTRRGIMLNPGDNFKFTLMVSSRSPAHTIRDDYSPNFIRDRCGMRSMFVQVH